GRLSDRPLRLWRYAECELVGPGIDRACKDRLLPELLIALRKKRKRTDSLAMAYAAYNALRKNGAPTPFRNLEKKLKELFPHSRIPDRTLRHIVANDDRLSRVIRGKAGNPN